MHNIRVLETILEIRVVNIAVHISHYTINTSWIVGTFCLITVLLVTLT